MSNQDRSIIPFFQTPAPFEEPPSKGYRAGKPKKTWSGRVVYDRKRHFFTEKDVKRILKNILENEGKRKADVLEFLDDWIQIESMLIQLLALEAGKIALPILIARLGPVIGELVKQIPEIKALIK